MKIFLSGTAGFIGFHLAQKLIKAGHEVISVDSINDYYEVKHKYARLAVLGFEQARVDQRRLVVSSRHAQHQFQKLDLNDKDRCRLFFQNHQFDAMIHLAAQAGVRYSLENPLACVNDNLSAFVNILEAARHQDIQHLIFASSSSVYGLNATTPFATHHGTQHPGSLYAATKKSGKEENILILKGLK